MRNSSILLLSIVLPIRRLYVNATELDVLDPSFSGSISGWPQQSSTKCFSDHTAVEFDKPTSIAIAQTPEGSKPVDPSSSATIASLSKFVVPRSLPQGVATNGSSVGSETTDDVRYRTGAYFVNWAIYGRDYHPQDLPADKLTHVFYAFAMISAETGEVTLSDSYADVEKHYATDLWSDIGTNLYGCLKQLFLLKKRNRKLKTLLSIGGSSYSPRFATLASTKEARQCFADSAVRLLMDLGFDGLDIDWEYPENDTEAQNYVLLLSAVREALDLYSQSLPQRPHLLLTVSSSCGPSHYQQMRLDQMDQYIDFWNLMAYDFAGSWTAIAGHQANLRPSQQNTTSTPFSIEAAVMYYTKIAGIQSDKIVLGMPLYGRVFANTDGPGSPYQGVGSEYSWESGVWDYKSLPRPGATERFDRDIGAAWSYDPIDRLMVTYDTSSSAIAKASYITQQRLGGAMWWESSGDKIDEKSLIHVVHQGLSGGQGQYMEMTDNILDYPFSRYDNVKDKFSDE